MRKVWILLPQFRAEVCDCACGSGCFVNLGTGQHLQKRRNRTGFIYPPQSLGQGDPDRWIFFQRELADQRIDGVPVIDAQDRLSHLGTDFAIAIANQWRRRCLTASLIRRPLTKSSATMYAPVARTSGRREFK